MSLQESEKSEKSRLITFLLALFLGFVGVDRFYTGKIVSGIFKILTFSGAGIWWLIDWIMALSGNYKDKFKKFVSDWKAEKKQLIIVVSVIAGIYLIGIIGLASSGGKSASTLSNINSNRSSTETTISSKETVSLKVGEKFTTKNFEVIVNSVKSIKKFGNEYLSESAAEGTTFVVVNLTYKNISQKPISWISIPTVKLIDSNHTEYDNDSTRTSQYLMYMNIDTAGLSDINPGISKQNVDLFEVAEEYWNKGGWKIIISESYKDYEVTF